VTPVASVAPEFAFVHTNTVTPRAVPPGTWFHVKDVSSCEPVVPVSLSDEAR
jgi:hypothetical protein